MFLRFHRAAHCRLLQRDPSKRPSAEEALQHAWLVNPPGYSPHVPSSTIVQRLADFTRMTRLQGLLMHVVAHQLSSNEVDNLHEIFDEMVRPELSEGTLKSQADEHHL